MKRRGALKTLATAAAALPLMRADLSASALAQADTLSGDQVFLLRDVAATVLPSIIGSKGQNEAVDHFLRWIRDYKEGVALSHGYGEPRLVKSAPSPAPRYVQQLVALQQAAQARGGRFGALPIETRRELLDAAFTAAEVRNLPGRPDGKHVIADLMSHYFRSSAANDLCYNARIGRNTYRAIRVTTVRPQPLAPQAPRPKPQAR
ncbi:MAG TPA: hypothetical protein VEA16_16175 [Vicinamibacterales bacterium]|nr:hypothetical protein [Vicinamibacterales bacterium]